MKGTNSVITCDRVTVLALYTFSDSIYQCFKVSFDSLRFFSIYAPDKLFIAKIKKDSHSINNGDEVKVLTFCT